MNAFRRSLQEILRYPSAIIGGVFVLFLIVVAIYAVISIPYQTAINLWRGGEDVWYRNPKEVPPVWVNWFSSK